MPCRCTGSLSFVHQSCLNQWIKSSDTRCCELCKFDFVMETKLKPLRKVQPPDCSSSILSLDVAACAHSGGSLSLSAVTPPLLLLLQWEKLNMSKSERRKIFCSVMFHVIAIVCMLWSVYVLVRRTAEEIRLGKNGQFPPSTPPPPSRSFTPVTLYHTPESSQAHQLFLLTCSGIIDCRWLS